MKWTGRHRDTEREGGERERERKRERERRNEVKKQRERVLKGVWLLFYLFKNKKP